MGLYLVSACHVCFLLDRRPGKRVSFRHDAFVGFDMRLMLRNIVS